MKILIIYLTFTKNLKEAANITTLNYAKSLQGKGHKVIIVAERRQNLPAFEKFNNIPVYRASFFSVRSFSITNKFLGIQSTLFHLKKKGFYPDIIHGFSSSTIISLNVVLAKNIFHRSKIIHTIKAESNASYDKIFSFLLNFTRFVTVSTYKQRRRLIKRGVKKSKIKIIRSHINTSKFRPMNKNKLKKKYSFTGRKIILNYGAMRIDKGTFDSFKSMQAVIKKNPKVLYIYICRWKDTEDIYHKFIKKYDLSDNVRIITDDVLVEEYAAMADIAVFPYQTLTRTESNPSCVLECLACKTPLITTNLPELKEILTDNHDCFMVPPSDIERISAVTIKLLENKEKQELISENGYVLAKKFSVDKRTDEFVQLYNYLLTQN